jgi:hypothetical protein
VEDEFPSALLRQQLAVQETGSSLDNRSRHRAAVSTSAPQIARYYRRARIWIDRPDPGGTPSPDTPPPGSKEPTS